MSKSTTTSTSDIEQLLTEAGVSFTVVDRCPAARCSICRRRTASRAA